MNVIVTGSPWLSPASVPPEAAPVSAPVAGAALCRSPSLTSGQSEHQCRTQKKCCKTFHTFLLFDFAQLQALFYEIILPLTPFTVNKEKWQNVYFKALLTRRGREGGRSLAFSCQFLYFLVYRASPSPPRCPCWYAWGVTPVAFLNTFEKYVVFSNPSSAAISPTFLFPDSRRAFAAFTFLSVM